VKLARFAVLAALLAQTGLPVAFAQGLAWAKMVRSGQSVVQAVEGRRPCDLCLKIRAAKSGGAVTVAPSRLEWHASAAPVPARVETASSVERSPSFVLSPAPSPSDPPPPRSLPS